jgi:alkylation response protein AidB-like acyl-CoA dehydrogenase
VRFAFSDDQLLFRDTVRAFLAKECPPEAVRAAWTDERGRVPGLWAGLAEMGVVGLTVPEAHGGLGLGELDLVLLLEECGRAAAPEPLVETTAVVAPLLASLASLGSLESQEGSAVGAWLDGIAAGTFVATVVVGPASIDTAGVVPFAEEADLLVVAGGDRVVAIAGDDLELVPERSVDGSRRLFTVDAHPSSEIVLAAAAPEVVNAAFDRGALGAAAQLLGLADRMLEITVEYVKEREQFGVPIGSFQAIKHHLADALLALEFARPVVYRAAYAMEHQLPSASRDVSMAKCYASDAASTVARKALQCHGAIGYTVEHDLHLWMKRVWALAAAWGDAAHHRARVADAVLGPRP